MVEKFFALQGVIEADCISLFVRTVIVTAGLVNELVAIQSVNVGWVEALRNPTNSAHVGFRSST
ncbi:hypothetical protein F7734_14400 [Scytonema sp. UIC 10036]|nr:hypothetical protein [Scytonema sp. UIC 10036]